MAARMGISRSTVGGGVIASLSSAGIACWMGLAPEGHTRHRSQEFLAFLKKSDEQVPAELGCHVLLDNASTHQTPAVKRCLTTHPRCVLHFTPTSSSWSNTGSLKLTTENCAAVPTPQSTNSTSTSAPGSNLERQPSA
jgi:hypothetical protein